MAEPSKVDWCFLVIVDGGNPRFHFENEPSTLSGKNENESSVSYKNNPIFPI